MNKDYLPHEIHITVSLKDNEISENFITSFKDICKELSVKPIVLDLESSTGYSFKDVMTSSKIYGDNYIVHKEIERITKGLERNEFTVVRKKIESVPWHPLAPVNEHDKMPENCYFEAHIGCLISINEKHKLNELTIKTGAHLSKNAFKKLENGKFVNMVTLRNNSCTSSYFKTQVEKFVALLKVENINFEKIETEFCLYDTKVSHDYLWLK